ncbi:uncharacterized protein BDW43DRAFT_304600 [Aspergillus alliaceus]|uniref:uncharacterized protein n=1 Tax=Petromyces alliaceus TaxID=209559 RepID=UPI0012A3FA46|nr:uncharacterized protein BDW43DRAFT_304600 [Aspergillus alliaceus]KAB8227438.1 hypothetical protein BDW43DRAFT_304600 [Aspergillus alliaceus]
MFHHDYTVLSTDKTPLFYIDNSSFTPKKPDLTFHAGNDKNAPVVGVSKFLHFSRHMKLGLGDPQNINTVEWEDLVSQNLKHNKYRWQMTVRGVSGAERRAFMWKRTHSVAVEGSSASIWSSRNFKLVDEQTEQIVAIFTSSAFKSVKKSGKLQISSNYGQEFDLMVLITVLSLYEKQRRRENSRNGGVCSNCSKRQAECEYDSVNFLLWTNEASHRSMSVISESKGPQLPEPTHESAKDDAAHSRPSLNLNDLELMMQWCNSTYQVLTRNERTDPVWRLRVPEEALLHPPLMHGILALSAVHIARTRDDHRRPEYISAAVVHQNEALASFRELLDDINDSNAKAMFALSGVVVVYAFGFPHLTDLEDPWACIDEFIQVLVLARGVQQVLNQATPSIQCSDWAILLRLDEYIDSLPKDAIAPLKRLRELNAYCGARDPMHDVDIYSITIDNLTDITAAAYGGLSSITVAARWAIKLKPKFVNLVRERSPLALVILAHLCVLLYRLKFDWCIDQWVHSLPKAVWRSLDDRWKPYAQWPMVEIFGPGFRFHMETG